MRSTPAVAQTCPVRRRRQRRFGILDTLDAIEIVAYGLGAFALLLFLVFLGIRAAHRIAGPVASGVAVVASVAAVAVALRDVRRRRWSPVSVGAACGYGLCLVAVIATDLVLS